MITIIMKPNKRASDRVLMLHNFPKACVKGINTQPSKLINNEIIQAMLAICYFIYLQRHIISWVSPSIYN